MPAGFADPMLKSNSNTCLVCHRQHPVAYLYEQVLLHNLLCLADQALLQGLDLLDHLVRAGVTALQLAPPAHSTDQVTHTLHHPAGTTPSSPGKMTPCKAEDVLRGCVLFRWLVMEFCPDWQGTMSVAQYLCTLSGLSSSSLSALTFVRSCSS